jgi:hypothetical protein
VSSPAQPEPGRFRVEPPPARATLDASHGFSAPRRSAGQEPSEAIGRPRLDDPNTALVEFERTPSTFPRRSANRFADCAGAPLTLTERDSCRGQYGAKHGGRGHSCAGQATRSSSRLRRCSHRTRRDPCGGGRLYVGHRLDRRPRRAARGQARFRFSARSSRITVQRRGRRRRPTAAPLRASGWISELAGLRAATSSSAGILANGLGRLSVMARAEWSWSRSESRCGSFRCRPSTGGGRRGDSACSMCRRRGESLP